MKKLIVAALAVGVLMGCSTAPKLADEQTTEPGVEGFYPVSSLQQFASAYVKSADALNGYTHVLYGELELANMEIDKSRLNSSSDYWELTQKDVVWAQDALKEQTQNYYSKERHLALMEMPVQKSLKVDMTLTKYRPNAPRDGSRGRTAGEVYFSEGAGRLYMTAQISDAETGVVLAVIEDDRELGTTWQKDGRVNNPRRIKQGLYTWVQRIDAAVAQLQ